MKKIVNSIVENEKAKMIDNSSELIRGKSRATNPVYAGIIAGLCSDGGFEYEYILETADCLFARIIARDMLDNELFEEAERKRVLANKAQEVSVMLSEAVSGLKHWAEVNELEDSEVDEVIHMILDDETEGDE